MAEVKPETHVVIKKEDITKYLGTKEAEDLVRLAGKVITRRVKDGKSAGYYVCNHDEPYADEVLDVILDGEEAPDDEEAKEEELTTEKQPTIDDSEEININDDANTGAGDQEPGEDGEK